MELDHLDCPDESLYYIYSHIINLYRKRRDVSKPKSIKSPTEYDYVIKVWGNILESPFPENKIYVKWGESLSAACEEDFKVDARIIVQVNDIEYDLANVEASREMTNQKIDDDRLKLIIESNCVLDHITKNTPSINLEDLRVLFIQLSGNQCDVSLLTLAAPGLYVVNEYL